MLSLDSINETILELEQKDTSFATCNRLAPLYIVRDHLTGQQASQPVPLSVEGQSNFLRAVNGRNSVRVWAIMDDLMDTLEVVSPKTYTEIMDQLDRVEKI